MPKGFFEPEIEFCSTGGTSIVTRGTSLVNYYTEDTENVWRGWVQSSCDNCTTDTAWRIWVDSASTASTGSVTYDATWVNWVRDAHDWQVRSTRNAQAANAARQLARPVETAEQRMAREAADVKRRADEALRMKAEVEKKAKAKVRAKKLLQDHITKEQRESLEKHGFFEVVVAGKTYRIRQGTHGNVRLIENGKEVKSFCIQPNYVPDEDAMLAQKLLLETDEASFLKIANATRLN